MRRDVRRIATLHDSYELAVQPGMLDAVRLGNRALWWLLFDRSTRKHIEGLALVGAFRNPVVRLVERDGVSVRRPGQHANVVPSFLEVDAVELQQRHGGVGPGRLPYLELARGADRSRLPGDDLHREVVKPLYLLRVRGHLDGDAELSPFRGQENLLPDKVGEPLVLVFLVGDDWKIRLDPDERDPLRRDLGLEFPLVEREIPVLAVVDDVASPGDRILQPDIIEILGQPPAHPPVGEAQLQHAAEDGCASIRQSPEAFVVLAHPSAGAGGVAEQLEVRNQSDFVQSGTVCLSVIAVCLRTQQVPDLRRRIRPPPALLAQELQNVLNVASQRRRNTLQQPQPQCIVDVPDRKLLERRAAERIFRARAQIRGEEDTQRGTQRPVR